MAIISHKVEGVANDVTHYTRIFPVNKKGHAQSELDGQITSALTNAFPTEPTEYILLETVTASKTWTAPESGYFQIEVYGASGNGGKGWGGRGTVGSGTEDDPVTTETCNMGGGGGGSGAYSSSLLIALNVGDTIELVCGAIGNDTSAQIHSSVSDEDNLTMTCTSASSGSNARFFVAGTGGAGGVATGGNDQNINGNSGGKGGYKYINGYNTPDTASGGIGGSAVVTDGNVGGRGAYAAGYTNSKATTTGLTYGSAGFIKIYRGDTNVVAA